MTLQLTTSNPRATTVRPALDRMTPDGRDALLDLMWAAWYSSRSNRDQALLAGLESSDPLDVARAAGITAEASLKLMRLRRLAAGDVEVVALVDGLREGSPLLHVPMRLRRVMGASDDERRRMLHLARTETARLPRPSAEAAAAVLGYLVGTQVEYERARVLEVPLARGFSRAVMSALGLPFGGYTARMRTWL